MVSGASNLIDVCVELRSDRPDSIGVYDGRNDAEGNEIWIWLPKSQIEFEPGKGGTVTVTLPEWLAAYKGLI